MVVDSPLGHLALYRFFISTTLNTYNYNKTCQLINPSLLGLSAAAQPERDVVSVDDSTPRRAWDPHSTPPQDQPGHGAEHSRHQGVYCYASIYCRRLLWKRSGCPVEVTLCCHCPVEVTLCCHWASPGILKIVPMLADLFSTTVKFEYILWNSLYHFVCNFIKICQNRKSCEHNNGTTLCTVAVLISWALDEPRSRCCCMHGLYVNFQINDI